MGLAVQIIGISAVVFTIISAIIGLAYKMGKLEQRVIQGEKDVNDLWAAKREDACAAKEELRIFREETRKNFDLVFSKIDNLPCHVPSKAKC
jgi:hypothetical protein